MGLIRMLVVLLLYDQINVRHFFRTSRYYMNCQLTLYTDVAKVTTLEDVTGIEGFFRGFLFESNDVSRKDKL